MGVTAEGLIACPGCGEALPVTLELATSLSAVGTVEDRDDTNSITSLITMTETTASVEARAEHLALHGITVVRPEVILEADVVELDP